LTGKTSAKADGSVVLGDPAQSVAWLANRLATFGLRIEAGQPIMSGSFTVPMPLIPGTRIESQFEPFGNVSVEVR
jgi:2-oxo-hept-3-ene-1,7-dioate hydratase